MNGFIVIAINKKEINSIGDGASESVNSYPVIAKDKKSVLSDFKKNHADLIVLSVIPLKNIKNNLKLIEDLAKQKNLAID